MYSYSFDNIPGTVVNNPIHCHNYYNIFTVYYMLGNMSTAMHMFLSSGGEDRRSKQVPLPPW